MFNSSRPIFQFSLIRLITAVMFSYYFLSVAFNPKIWHFIDSVSLIFHEAGHTLFYFFGQTLYILGGSIFQVALPLCIALYFVIKKQYFSAAIMLLWTGQSLVNVSVYAGDALKMELPLLGGDKDSHDWNTFFAYHGLLRKTEIISAVFYYSGMVVIALGGIFSLVFSFFSYSDRERIGYK